MQEFTADWQQRGNDLRTRAQRAGGSGVARDRKIANLADAMSEGGGNPAIPARLTGLETLRRKGRRRSRWRQRLFVPARRMRR